MNSPYDPITTLKELLPKLGSQRDITLPEPVAPSDGSVVDRTISNFQKPGVLPKTPEDQLMATHRATIVEEAARAPIEISRGKFSDSVGEIKQKAA